MGWITEALKAIIDAGKGNGDFIAFALIAVLSIAALVGGAGFAPAAGIAVVLASVWVLMRYGLVALQSHERLRDLRENATIEAQKKLAEHATKDEVADLFADHGRSGGENEY